MCRNYTQCSTLCMCTGEKDQQTHTVRNILNHLIKLFSNLSLSFVGGHHTGTKNATVSLRTRNGCKQVRAASPGGVSGSPVPQAATERAANASTHQQDHPRHGAHDAGVQARRSSIPLRASAACRLHHSRPAAGLCL